MAIITANYFSDALRKKVTYRAIIPETYKRKQGTSKSVKYLYPTLYLLHGYTGDQNVWLEFSTIRQIAEEYEIAVIMPAGENSFYFDSPIGPQFSTFIGQELVEKTRTLFPLSLKREDTLLVGTSMGGYGALLNGLLYKNTFGYVGSFSGVILSASPEVNEGSAKIPIPILQTVVESGEWKDLPPELDLLQLFDKKGKSSVSQKLFLSCGTEDYLYRENSFFHRYLENKHIAHFYFEGPGEHNWPFWNHVLKIFMEWYENGGD